MSPSWPPSAAKGLFDDTEANIWFAKAVFAKFGFTNLKLVSSKTVNTPASTFEATPPPVKYLNVNVVL